MLRTIFSLFENPGIMFFNEYDTVETNSWNSIRWSIIYREATRENFITDAIRASMYRYREELKQQQKEIDDIKKKLASCVSSKDRLNDLMSGSVYEYREKQIQTTYRFMDLVERKVLTSSFQDEFIECYNEVKFQGELTEDETEILNKMVVKISCDYLNSLLKWMDVGISFTTQYTFTSSTVDIGCFAAVVLGLIEVIENHANLRVCPICNRPFLPSATHPKQETCGKTCSKRRNEINRKGKRKR